jgi:hydrogenase/urease accessory protein HupE
MRAGVGRWLIALFFLAIPASAHQFDPVLLNIRELDGDRFQVVGRTPANALREDPVFPGHCVAVVPLSVHAAGSNRVYRTVLHCPGIGLAGQPFAFPTGTEKEVMLSLTFADGHVLRTVLRPERSGFILPARTETGFADVFRAYSGLGFFHILEGWDHLLFILALVMLVQGFRNLALTVSAFTVGHSLTLSLAALGWLRLPSPPVEACIAASIVLLAAEGIRPGPDRFAAGRAGARKWILALVFGLAHGLGFAGALEERGLPVGDIPAALFAFNGGVEAGQLLCVAVTLSAQAVWRLLPDSLHAPVWSRAMAYAIGSTGAFWFCQRVASIFPTSQP